MNPAEVLKKTAIEYGVTTYQLMGNSRKRPLPEARQMVSYILRHFPLPVIASTLRRDRTTAYYAIARMGELISIYPDIKQRYDNILISLNPNDYMTIKLNHNQLEGIYNFIALLLQTNQPTNVGESLLHELVFKISERIRAKLARKQYDSRAGNNIKLSSIESKAFYVWYNQTVNTVPEATWTYERIVGTDIIKQIDREYA